MVPLTLYQICFANVARGWTITLISISLAFGKCFATLPNSPLPGANNLHVPLDIVVFAIIVAQRQLMRSLHRGVNVPSILNTVSRDAGVYFAVIASSHFAVVVLYSVGRVRNSLHGFSSLTRANC